MVLYGGWDRWGRIEESVGWYVWRTREKALKGDVRGWRRMRGGEVDIKLSFLASIMLSEHAHIT